VIPPSASFLLLKVGAARCCCRGSASSLPPLPCFAPPVGAALLYFAPQIEGARLHLRRPRSRPSAGSPPPRITIGSSPLSRIHRRAAAHPHLRTSRRPSSAAVHLPSARASAVRTAPSLLVASALQQGTGGRRSPASHRRLGRCPSAPGAVFFSAAVCLSAPGRRVHSPSSVLLPWGPLRLLLLSAAFRLGLPVWM